MATTGAGVSGRPVRIDSGRGPISCLYHQGRTGRGAVIWVGGTDGGFDGPAGGIYTTLAEDLLAEGIGSLRLDFRLHRAPGDVSEGAHDVLAGISFLKDHSVGPIALVGHSFGGAAVIAAAALSRQASAVVTLSTQTAGTDLAPEVSPAALLLVHGELDRRLPPQCSRYVYSRAREPKELVVLPGAKHSLRQRRDELRTLLRQWLKANLQPRL